MFEWYWVFVFYALYSHVKYMAMTIMVHRGVGHSQVTLSKPLEYFFRFMLWTSRNLSYSWAETYASRHRKHHHCSDSLEDPHGVHMTLDQMMQPWKLEEADKQKYAPNVKTPDDWMQRTLHEKYFDYGPYVLFLTVLALYGSFACLLIVFFVYNIERKMEMFLSNWMFHRVGYTNKDRTHPSDQSKNVFPIGIFLLGEELHGNHHDYPNSPNFAKRWYEFDLGWQYIKILSFFKLLKINKL